MKSIDWKKLLPHFVALGFFVIVAIVYCHPVLQGKELPQHDLLQWRAMARDAMEYNARHHTPPMWANNMFGGMPAYLIAMKNNGNPISIIYIGSILNYVFPTPVVLFIVASISFYFLCLVVRINPYIAIIGALAYTYNTYNPIIIGAGHMTKMIALGYLPFFIGSLLLIYQKQYLWGLALTAISSALLINANHLQITYYAFIIAGIMTLFYVVKWIKEKSYKHIFRAGGAALIGVLLGIGITAVPFFMTYEYAKYSIRGGSLLAQMDSTTAQESTSKGLSKDYAFSYSIYKTEPLVMLFPKLYGGSSNQLEIAEEKSQAIAKLQEMPPQLANQLQGFLQFYWGGIDGVGTSGPPYAGIIICFFALLGFLWVKNTYRWWILAVLIISLLMSWGKYFMGFNELLFNYLPFYNKFRAPSMILVVPALLLSFMAALSLNTIANSIGKTNLLAQYKKGLYIVGAFFIMALLLYFTADYTTSTDKMLLQQASELNNDTVSTAVKGFLKALQADRKTIALNDILRSFIFVAIAASLLFFTLKQKIKISTFLTIIGVLVLIDLFSINLKYLSSETYVEKEEIDLGYFTPSAIDKMIKKDTTNYRVLDITNGIQAAFNGGAMPAYQHNIVGGYHAAKLAIYQDLIENQLYKFPNSMPSYNMLNTKYIIHKDEKTGQQQVIQNPAALGNAWFAQKLQYYPTRRAVMNALDNFNPKTTAILYTKDSSNIKISTEIDTTATIRLLKNDNDEVVYEAATKTDQFAVFSEVFYEKGWTAKIDNQPTPIYNVNYVLRGIVVPTGKHQIIFEFKPALYMLTNRVSIVASAITWLLLLGAILSTFLKKKNRTISKT